LQLGVRVGLATGDEMGVRVHRDEAP